jgi:hypothetical protein
MHHIHHYRWPACWSVSIDGLGPQETLTLDEQVEYIERTFEEANQDIIGTEHPKKPGVTVEKCLPIVPDFEYWRYRCVCVCAAVTESVIASDSLGCSDT